MREHAPRDVPPDPDCDCVACRIKRQTETRPTDGGSTNEPVDFFVPPAIRRAGENESENL